MKDEEKLRLLKSLRLLDQIPDAQLVKLAEFLKPMLIEAPVVIFEEGSKGTSLYFVSSGQVKISKKISATITKDLAILGSGDCFGEMALIEEVSRSATAATLGPAVLFELARADLNRWLKSNPELAMGFFAELVQVQSGRLRRTSNELAMLYDLSSLLLERVQLPLQFIAKSLERICAHLDGNWSAAAYLYNVFNDELEFAASTGPAEFDKDPSTLPPPADEPKNNWTDSSTFHLFLPEQKRFAARVVFKSAASLSREDRTEAGRTLTTVSRLMGSALENINYRTDEELRNRLKSVRANAG
jgi:CRP/FNR family transcriptional regulator, cyclic AMP receptor protein